jgi:hypothetical protein
MEKKVINLFALLSLTILFLSIANAANSTNGTIDATIGSSSNSDSSNLDKAYTCLNNKVKNGTLSFQDSAFSAMALGNKYNLISNIDSTKGSDCWPKSGCRLKDTSIAALAYNRAGKDTKSIVNWISSKNSSATELQWFIEIDITNHESSNCKVNYDGNDKLISVGEDMSLSGSGGSCLSVSPNGYWLRISNSCIDKEYQISCDKDFVTSIVYQKSSGETVYVSSTTNGASSSGTTKEKVIAKCFKTGSSCDYEGTLWASLALKKASVDVSDYLPYLISFKEDNAQYFPSSILYVLNGGQEDYSYIIQNQKQSKFWEMTGSVNNKFFDTALAMLSLQGSSAIELDNAKNYLLSIQSSSGCWNNDNIRDTAFLLYAGWQKATTSTGGSDGVTLTSCSSFPTYDCALRLDCLGAGGSVLNGYSCPNSQEYCCNVKVEQKMCRDLGGNICANGQSCTGTSARATDGTCCVGTCQTESVSSLCEQEAQGICKTSCDSSNENEASQSCVGSQVCCVAKAESGGSSMWVWITLLILLILIVILAILYRDRLRVWWFEFRGRSSSSPIMRGRPSPPGYGQIRPMQRAQQPFRPAINQQRQMPIQRQPQPPMDKDMEDTFKKLRDMSK